MDQMIAINKIYNEDCLDGMQKIDDKSIDLICTDLPYGQTFHLSHYGNSMNVSLKIMGQLFCLAMECSLQILCKVTESSGGITLYGKKHSLVDTLMQIRCRSGNMKISVFFIKNYLHIIRKKQADIQEK